MVARYQRTIYRRKPMQLQQIRCPLCNSKNLCLHTTYSVLSGEQRKLYACLDCGSYFAETKNTPIAGLRRPISFIILVMNALNEGLSINATYRTFRVSKNSIRHWMKRISKVKETLLLYALCQKFLRQIIEGDELYTKVHHNTPPQESEGWTIVLMDRATRFLWELSCGERDRELFKTAMQTLSQIIAQTKDLTLLTDGERRYGNLLFEICQEVLRTGKPGCPKKTLPEGVTVRVKNKGSQSHKKGRKRPKYQAPWNKHPDTEQNLENQNIHANHTEAFNSSLRRRMSCYRRKTNTYVKE